jgi:hypothetical protein
MNPTRGESPLWVHDLGALQANALLSGQAGDAREVRSVLELAGIGAGTALTLDALLNLL